MTHATTVSNERTAGPSLRGMWRAWGVYGASSILNRSIAFLLLPLYTRVLSPEEYGIRAMVGLGLDLVGLLVSFGLKEAINRFYTGGGPDGAPRPEAASTGILAHAALIGGGVAVGIALAPWLSGLLLGDPMLAPYLRLGLVAAFFVHTLEAAFVYMRARGRAGTLALVSLVHLVAMVALNLMFVVGLRRGVAGIFYAEILASGVLAVIFTVRTLREVGVRFVPALARQMLRFGAPLMCLPFAWMFVKRIDILFLTHYGSLAYVGIYALAVQYAQVLQFVVLTPFQNYWDPAQFEVARDASGGRTYRRIFQWFTFTSVVAAFGLAVMADDVIGLMAAPAFHGAAAVAPMLLVAFLMLGFQGFFKSGLLIRNRTALVGVVAALTAAVNVGVNAIAVPHFLAAGAAAARVVAMVVMVLVTFLLAQRLWPQRPDLAGFARLAGLAVGLFLLSRWLPEMPVMLTIGVKAALVAALVGLGVWTGAVERPDVANAWAVVRARLRRRGGEAEAVSPTS